MLGTSPRAPNGKEKIQCSQCSKILFTTAHYISHLKRHTKDITVKKEFECRTCRRVFKVESNALEHEKVCGLQDSFPCDGCGKRCENQGAAEAHARSHHKSCVCHLCGLSFGKPESLKQHTLNIHEATRMVCHYCGKSFIRKARLLEHLQRHTGQMDFTCHICGKGSTNSYAFGVHLATHTEETPFKCSFCPRAFKHMKYVYLHERAVHYKIKPKKKNPGKNMTQRTCPDCGKTFRRESAMLIHKRSIHEGKNGYICKLCGKDFKYTYLLYIHKKKQHFPELCKYTCQFCQRPFPVRTELEKHLRKHTGEKPYVCAHCDKRYSFHGSLNMHIRTQHQQPKNKFPCTLCEASFNFRSHLLRHMAAHVDKISLPAAVPVFP